VNLEINGNTNFLHALMEQHQMEEEEICGTCNTNGGEEERVYMLLVKKQEGKRPLGRRKHKCVDNVEMDLGETG
jgi:hypothetical protein